MRRKRHMSGDHGYSRQGVAYADKAPDCGPGRRRFDSALPDFRDQ